MVTQNKFPTTETAWCPGCGDFGILDALKETLNEMDKQPQNVLIVGGIGQAAKLPQYIKANGFCGLHGRAIPAAIAAKIANKDLEVIINTGDGDCYGEGGNHFIHNIRRNVNISCFIHNNQVYGLTKGQASPTADSGYITKAQPSGTINVPINPILMAIAIGAGFVARSFSGRKKHLKKMMKAAIEYKGFSLVDILQPCVTFNKVNTAKWYNERSYELDDNYDHTNRLKAMEKAMEWEEKIPLGIIFSETKVTYHERIGFINDRPLVDEETSIDQVKKFIKEFV